MKVLASRRRLLYMLLVLALGSGALAVTKMAAWWVVVPPTIMLLGYTGMLREAAKADAERRELTRTRATAAAAVAAARRDAAPVPAAPLAPPAPVPEAEVIDISASLTSAGQEFYDQYADAKLRAVGDLALVERHETPDPVRSSAVESRFHCVVLAYRRVGLVGRHSVRGACGRSGPGGRGTRCWGGR